MGLLRWLKRKPKVNSQDETVSKEGRVVQGDDVPNKEVNTKPTDQSSKDNKGESKNRYHVSQNKDESSPHYKEWRVRKEGSDKTIQYFSTQKQAIEDAEKRAKKSGGSIVIHKVDGTIRKQKYS